jgi:DnaK suppressor protein
MDTQKARIQLESLRSQLLSRLDRIEGHIRRDGEALNQDSEEAAVERENDQVLDGLSLHEREELNQIDHALGRIANGQYQVCSKCGGAITADRLSALPYTTVCTGCA